MGFDFQLQYTSFPDSISWLFTAIPIAIPGKFRHHAWLPLQVRKANLHSPKVVFFQTVLAETFMVAAIIPRSGARVNEGKLSDEESSINK